MTSIWLVTLALVAIIFLVKEFMKRKKLPPGPIGLPLLGNLHMFGENLHQDLFKIAKKYGAIMTIYFGLVPTIIASSPRAAQQFLKNHDQIFASRPYHAACYYIFYKQRNLIMGKYGPYWRHMRKLCTQQLLSNVKINSFQSMRKQELQILVNFLEKAASNRDVVDLSAKLASLSANMACLMVIGKKYNNVDGNFKDMVKETSSRMAATPNLAELFPFLRFIDFQGSIHRMKQIAKSCDEFLENVIDEHARRQYSSDQSKTSTDMVYTLMEIMQSGEAEFEFDRRHVKAILHPNVMKKLQIELDYVVGQKGIVEEKDLENLDYLNMVIKEGFRLHPVAPLLLPHESIED
ncbi:hypothetical protein H5410_022988 [Solanum commersonii]|uniref:Cytochrome P450 n=1 Tax=Solanum commersonii TaxID=4109 RepID=A0A9J5ZFL0_SOLCO|nr:hypothetical protein H5410_022988 [Solanum commersonii]